MSVGEVAGLIAACALLILVGLLAYPILKLGKVFDETRIMVKGVSNETIPLLGEVTTTVTTTNAQLAKVDTITDNATTVTTNAAALMSLFSATAGGPLVKAAAFTYGVRRALGDQQGGGSAPSAGAGGLGRADDTGQAGAHQGRDPLSGGAARAGGDHGRGRTDRGEFRLPVRSGLRRGQRGQGQHPDRAADDPAAAHAAGAKADQAHDPAE